MPRFANSLPTGEVLIGVSTTEWYDVGVYAELSDIVQHTSPAVVATVASYNDTRYAPPGPGPHPFRYASKLFIFQQKVTYRNLLEDVLEKVETRWEERHRFANRMMGSSEIVLSSSDAKSPSYELLGQLKKSTVQLQGMGGSTADKFSQKDKKSETVSKIIVSAIMHIVFTAVRFVTLVIPRFKRKLEGKNSANDHNGFRHMISVRFRHFRTAGLFSQSNSVEMYFPELLDVIEHQLKGWYIPVSGTEKMDPYEKNLEHYRTYTQCRALGEIEITDMEMQGLIHHVKDSRNYRGEMRSKNAVKRFLIWNWWKIRNWRERRRLTIQSSIEDGRTAPRTDGRTYQALTTTGKDGSASEGLRIPRELRKRSYELDKKSRVLHLINQHIMSSKNFSKNVKHELRIRLDFDERKQGGADGYNSAQSNSNAKQMLSSSSVHDQVSSPLTRSFFSNPTKVDVLVPHARVFFNNTFELVAGKGKLRISGADIFAEVLQELYVDHFPVDWIQRSVKSLLPRSLIMGPSMGITSSPTNHERFFKGGALENVISSNNWTPGGNPTSNHVVASTPRKNLPATSRSTSPSPSPLSRSNQSNYIPNSNLVNSNVLHFNTGGERRNIIFESRLHMQTLRKHRTWRHPIHGENRVERLFILSVQHKGCEMTALLTARSLNSADRTKALYRITKDTQVHLGCSNNADGNKDKYSEHHTRFVVILDGQGHKEGHNSLNFEASSDFLARCWCAALRDVVQGLHEAASEHRQRETSVERRQSQISCCSEDSSRCGPVYGDEFMGDDEFASGMDKSTEDFVPHPSVHSIDPPRNPNVIDSIKEDLEPQIDKSDVPVKKSNDNSLLAVQEERGEEPDAEVNLQTASKADKASKLEPPNYKILTADTAGSKGGAVDISKSRFLPNVILCPRVEDFIDVSNLLPTSTSNPVALLEGSFDSGTNVSTGYTITTPASKNVTAESTHDLPIVRNAATNTTTQNDDSSQSASLVSKRLRFLAAQLRLPIMQRQLLLRVRKLGAVRSKDVRMEYSVSPRVPVIDIDDVTRHFYLLTDILLAKNFEDAESEVEKCLSSGVLGSTKGMTQLASLSTTGNGRRFSFLRGTAKDGLGFIFRNFIFHAWNEFVFPLVMFSIVVSYYFVVEIFLLQVTIPFIRRAYVEWGKYLERYLDEDGKYALKKKHMQMLERQQKSMLTNGAYDSRSMQGGSTTGDRRCGSTIDKRNCSSSVMDHGGSFTSKSGIPGMQRSSTSANPIGNRASGIRQCVTPGGTNYSSTKRGSNPGGRSPMDMIPRRRHTAASFRLLPHSKTGSSPVLSPIEQKAGHHHRGVDKDARSDKRTSPKKDLSSKSANTDKDLGSRLRQLDIGIGSVASESRSAKNSPDVLQNRQSSFVMISGDKQGSKIPAGTHEIFASTTSVNEGENQRGDEYDTETEKNDNDVAQENPEVLNDNDAVLSEPRRSSNSKPLVRTSLSVQESIDMLSVALQPHRNIVEFVGKYHQVGSIGAPQFGEILREEFPSSFAEDAHQRHNAETVYKELEISHDCENGYAIICIAEPDHHETVRVNSIPSSSLPTTSSLTVSRSTNCDSSFAESVSASDSLPKVLESVPSTIESIPSLSSSPKSPAKATTLSNSLKDIRPGLHPRPWINKFHFTSNSVFFDGVDIENRAVESMISLQDGSLILIQKGDLLWRHIFFFRRNSDLVLTTTIYKNEKSEPIVSMARVFERVE